MSQSRRRNILRQVFIAVVIVAIAAALAVAMMSLNKSSERKLEAYMPAKVAVREVVFEDKLIDIHTRGLVSARTKMPLLPEVSGKVIWVSPKWVNGGFFLKDELMLNIEDQKYRNQVARAKSDVAQANSQFIQEQGIAFVAKQEWKDRLKGGNKAAEQLALRKPQLASANAQLSAAKEALASVELDLSKTKIKAPYDGLLSNRQVDIGQSISGGQQLARFHAVDFVEIRVPLTQVQVNFLELPAIGMSSQLPVKLISRTGDLIHEWVGTLVRTEGLLDEKNRVLFGIVEVMDPYGLKAKSTFPLRIGAFVEAVLQSKALPNIVTLPRRLLRTGNHLWLVDKNDQLEKRKVEVLPTRSKDILVFQGLKAGDRVVTSGIVDPVEGRKVVVETADLLVGP